MSGPAGRGLRITAVVVVVGLIVGVVVDRVAARVVAGQIATQAQRTEHLPSRPTVSLGGFPFLTQVVAGNYRNVRVDVRGHVEQDVRVDRVHADLAGVRLPFADVVRGEVRRIPVDRLTARVELTFADVNAYLRSQGSTAAVSPDGQGIRVAGSVEILGTAYPVSGTADVGVQPAAVTFTPRELSGSVGAILPPALRQAAAALLTVRVPVAGLPFNMQLTSATVMADRIAFAAGGHDVVLDADAATAGR
ncbi:LmeA family phospholipid-binding protein [Frankia gtarii]|uniref:LmeA family phospholipid-binding protein n=1 Tax=Frankia gtarii TaxID=2950102 RepID=UPI0021BE0B2F|nr:DUF2993 domain-containing protein [Frankia gtarii]